MAAGILNALVFLLVVPGCVSLALRPKAEWSFPRVTYDLERALWVAAEPASGAKLTIRETNEHLTRQQSERWIQERSSYLASVYEKRLDPYFGQSADSDRCAIEWRSASRKIVRDGAIGFVYTLSSNQTGAVGVCAPEEQTHSLQMVFGACLNRPRQFDLKVLCPISKRNSKKCQASDLDLVVVCNATDFNALREMAND